MKKIILLLAVILIAAIAYSVFMPKTVAFEKDILSADPIGSVTSGDLSNFSTTISFIETQETDQVSQFRLRYFSIKNKAKGNIIYDSHYCFTSSNKIVR